MKRCARCGKRLPTSRPRVFSQFTRLYYCADIPACERRVARQARKAVPA